MAYSYWPYTDGRVEQWVPNGATVSTIAEGDLVPGNFGFGSYAHNFSMEFRVAALDGTVIGGDLFVGGGGDDSGAPRHFGPYSSVSWRNDTGTDQYVVMYLEPSYMLAESATWTLDFTVSVANSGGPFCREAAEGSVPNAAEPNSCGAQPNAADPVNVIQGNFWETWTDLSLEGRGPGLGMARTYSSSRSTVDGPLGFGWSFPYGMAVTTAGGVARVVQENGAVAVFTQASSVWVSPPRVNATLTQAGDGSWTFARAGREVFKFASAGQLLSVADLSGNQTTLTYSAGKLAAVTDASGRSLTVTWTGNHISKVAAPASVLRTGGAATPIQVTYSYDAAGNLATVTEPNGGVWTFGYDANHRVLTVREPRHHSLGAAAPVVENHYDAQGRVDWQEDRLDRRTSFDWSTPDRTTVTDPAGRVTVFEHVNGICTGVVKDPGPQQSRWVFEVDEATLGRTKTTDPTGVTTSTTFNDRALPTSVTTPKGTTTIAYDPVTLVPTSVQDPAGVTTTMTYDPGTDRLRSVSRPIPEGGGPWTTSFTYGDAANPGRVTSMVDQRGKTWTSAYDSRGNLASVTDPVGNRTTYTNNILGWVLASVAPAGNVSGAKPAQHTTAWEYNPVGDLLKTTDPLGAITERGVDLSGYPTFVKDPVPTGSGAEQTNLSWNAAGELVSVQRPDGSSVATDYWPDGAIKTQRDGASAITSYGYDSQGRLATVTDPANRTSTSAYDAAGRVTATQQPGGDCTASPKLGCTTFAYSGAGELEAIDYSDPATPDVTFGYDALGRRISMTDAAGTSTWVWDSVGRLRSFSDPTGTVSYGFADAGPAATSVTYPGGKTLTRAFDAVGRLASTTGWTGGTASYGWDRNSNPTTIDTAASTKIEDTTGYDRANRPSSYALKRGSSTLGSLSYTRDPEGMVRTSSGTGLPGATATYGYSLLDQLTSDPSGAYTYDLADNLTGFSTGPRQRFTPANELCYQGSTNTAACATPPVGATTYGYDGRGNRTTETPSTGLARSLTYDQANRLTGVTTGALATTYAYSGDGLRRSKTAADGTVTKFTWDRASNIPLLLAESIDAPGTANDKTVRYVYGPGGLVTADITTPASGAEVVRWYHHDQLGSTRALTDAAGNLIGSYAYSPYGQTTATTGTATTPIGWAGEYKDAETGYIYLRARHYDPVTAQFLTRDPLASISREPYGYSMNNPLNNTDPTGLWCPLGKNPNGSCRGSGAVEAVGDAARSAPAQTMKSAANTVSAVSGGIAAVSAGGAAAFPIAAPALVPIAGGAEMISASTSVVATIIECADGGAVFNCAAGIAATAIPFVSFPVLKQLERMYGPELGRLGNALLGALGLSAIGAAEVRNRQDRC